MYSVWIGNIIESDDVDDVRVNCTQHRDKNNDINIAEAVTTHKTRIQYDNNNKWCLLPMSIEYEYY